MNNDKLVMENYLLILKSTVEVFIHGTLESSNKDVRDSLKNGLDTIINSQGNTYNLMTGYGWYSVNNVESSELNKTINKIKNI